MTGLARNFYEVYYRKANGGKNGENMNIECKNDKSRGEIMLKVKLSRNRPGVAQRVLGRLDSQIS
jgi:hypothetical protein